MWHVRADEFQGKTIGRVDVAVTGPHSPVPPGMPRLPGPGEYYASPAMTKLLQQSPAAELGDRYPGKEVGTIGAAALPSPTSLIIVVGRTPAELSSLPDTSKVTSIATTSPSSCDNRCYDIGINGDGIDLVLAVAAGALHRSRADFHRRRHPVVCRPARATVRRDAARRRHTAADLGHLSRGIDGRRGHRRGARLRVVLRATSGARADSLHWRAVLSHSTSHSTFPTSSWWRSVCRSPLRSPPGWRCAGCRSRRSGVSRRVTPRPPRAYRLIPLFAGLA